METEPSIPGVIRFLSFQIFLCNVAENSKSPVRGCQGKPCLGGAGILPAILRTTTQIQNRLCLSRRGEQDAGASLRNHNAYRNSNQAKRAYNRGIPGL